MLVTVEQGVKLLHDGEVVAIPTETVYGLAGRIDNEQTLKRIFTVKQRPFFDPLIVHVADIEQAKTLVSEWSEVHELLARKFWPGSLTLVAPKNERISNLITSGLESVALRCPDHPVALEILRKVSVPLAAPSANRFGRTSPTAAIHVEEEFSQTILHDGRREIAVVDGGESKVGVESTVLSSSFENGKWKLLILRPGGTSQRQLREAMQASGLPFTLERAESAASPGHLPHHYQPNRPVIFLGRNQWSPDLESKAREQFGVHAHFKHLNLPESASEAARVLYAEFRRLSQDSQTVILMGQTKAQLDEDWDAIWDRVKRASSLNWS